MLAMLPEFADLQPYVFRADGTHSHSGDTSPVSPTRVQCTPPLSPAV